MNNFRSLFLAVLSIGLSLVFIPASANTITPVNVSAVSLTTGVQVAWFDNGATSYRVYRELRNDDGTYNYAVEIINGLSSSTYTDTTPTTGERYKYFAIACDADGACSTPSDGVEVEYNGTGTTTASDTSCSVYSSSSANSIPSNVALTENSGIYTLAWVAPEDSVKWNVYRNDVWETTVTSGIPSYTVENYLSTDSFYVTAIFSDESISSKSDIVSLTVTATDSTAFEAALIALQADYDALLALTVIAADDLELALASNATLTADLATAEALLTTTDSDALAAIAAAEALQATAEADLVVAEAALATAEASLATSEAALLLATSDSGTLATDLATAEADRDTALADLATANAALATAEADRDTAEADLATCEADLATEESASLIVATDLVTAQTDLAACLLLVP